MNREAASGAGPDSVAKVNGLAIASLVLGVVWLMGIGSILALVFGYVAKGQIEAAHGRQDGYGLAIAGIVLGWLGVSFVAVGIVMMTLGWMGGPWSGMMRMH